MNIQSFYEKLGPKSREYLTDFILLIISIIWGSTFIIIKQTTVTAPTFFFLFVRFFVVAFLLSLFCANRFYKINRKIVRDGILLGVILFGCYAFQTASLVYCSASVTAFLSSLFMVIVPIISTLYLKKIPHINSIIGVCLSLLGTGLMTLDEKSLTFSLGEILALTCSVFISFQIILLDYLSKGHDVFLLTLIQFVVLSLCSGLLSLLIEPIGVVDFSFLNTYTFWGVVAYTGIIATGFGIIVQTGFQHYTTPTKAAIIYSMEPMSSLWFSYIIGNEILSYNQYIGCFLIFFAVILAEIGSFFRIKKEIARRSN